MQSTGHTAMQGASVQCMQATDTELSPGPPSLMVTTRRRLTPHGVSFSFLHAVTQPLQSMQRSLSQRNFILAAIMFSCHGIHYQGTIKRAPDGRARLWSPASW